MRRVFHKVSQLLVLPSAALPKSVIFHALVAGFDIEAAGSDPTAFFTYLADENAAVETRCLLLHAPPIIPPAQKRDTLAIPTVKKAYDDARRLDVIVTSAAVFEHEHSQLRRYYTEHSNRTLDCLINDGCIGDMLWQPIRKDGPIDTSAYPYRALTLVELDEFPDRIAKEGQKILLVVGRCADPKTNCDGSKAEVLDAILHFSRKYLSHLVLDNRTAQELKQCASPTPASFPRLSKTAAPRAGIAKQTLTEKRVEILSEGSSVPAYRDVRICF